MDLQPSVSLSAIDESSVAGGKIGVAKRCERVRPVGHDFAGADDPEHCDESRKSAMLPYWTDAEVAVSVMEFEELILLMRRAAAAWLTAHGEARPSLSLRPSSIERIVFTALAQVYGTVIVGEGEFAAIREHIAIYGAVNLVQRVMWGSHPVDAWLATRLRAAHAHFEVLTQTWPEHFLTQAQAALAGYRAAPHYSAASALVREDERRHWRNPTDELRDGLNHGE
ncbi:MULTISPECIES: hypothetical protein [unclassified Caballeronia]|uniref:hypothetical protein n=1 Tax=unclassified Caballeronia TaxID=2646786 RepID=UPI002028903F|nr:MULTISPECIES: hypothetical protein [unclassified Caballeronia]